MPRDHGGRFWTSSTGVVLLTESFIWSIGSREGGDSWLFINVRVSSYTLIFSLLACAVQLIQELPSLLPLAAAPRQVHPTKNLALPSVRLYVSPPGVLGVGGS